MYAVVPNRKAVDQGARELWIDSYAAEHSDDRDDLLRNPGTLFQVIVWQVALCR